MIGTSPGLTAVADMAMRINGGYFVLRQGIFDYLNEGEDLVMDACIRAAKDGRMRAVQYDGFWAPMDTLKERTALEEQYRRGQQPVGALAYASRGAGTSDHSRPGDRPGSGLSREL